MYSATRRNQYKSVSVCVFFFRIILKCWKNGTAFILEIEQNSKL